MKITSGRIKVFSFLLGFSVMGGIWVYAHELQPVGAIDGEKIYKYQLNEYLSDQNDNAVKNIAEDRVFYKAMSELGVSASEDEVNAAMFDIYARYGGQADVEIAMLDTAGGINEMKNSIRIGICRSKAIDLFKQETEVSDEEIAYHYTQNIEKYSGEYKDIKDKVKEDLLSEKGGEKLEEYLREFKAKSRLIIF